MNDTAHEKRIKNIEAECLELKKQILQFEFQHKKDIAEFEKRHKKDIAEFDRISQIRSHEHERRTEERERRRKEIDKNLQQLSAHAAHLSKLTGIAFEELGEIDQRLESASLSLSRKRKKSK